MNHQKLIEGAMGMLARVIPAEEYAKANAALGQLVTLFQSIEDRARRTEENTAYVVKHIDELRDRLAMLEGAAATDSPAFAAMRNELALWMVPGSIELALAPAKEGSINNDH